MPPDTETTRLNIRASADHLRHESDVLRHLIQTDGLRVVGAEYDVATGLVDFFDDMTDADPPRPTADCNTGTDTP